MYDKDLCVLWLGESSQLCPDEMTAFVMLDLVHSFVTYFGDSDGIGETRLLSIKTTNCLWIDEDRE